MGALLVGCGGRFRHDGDGQTAGATGSPAGGSGGLDEGAGSGGLAEGGSAAGATCGEPQAIATPVDFILQSNDPVWIRHGCTFEFQIAQACPSGNLPVTSDPSLVGCFALPCSDTGTCYACLPCPAGAEPVTSGLRVSSGWDGVITNYGTTVAGCTCADKQPAPAGHYTLSVSAFLSEADALANRNGYPHTVAFDLPTSQPVVVDLGFTGI